MPQIDESIYHTIRIKETRYVVFFLRLGGGVHVHPVQPLATPMFLKVTLADAVAF